MVDDLNSKYFNNNVISSINNDIQADIDPDTVYIIKYYISEILM